MPVEFLTDEEVAAYGRFNGPPSRVELERSFLLNDRDRELVSQRRRPHTRLGFALQLGTVRFLGAFLADPLDVPAEVVAYQARQLGIEDVSCLLSPEGSKSASTAAARNLMAATLGSDGAA